MRFVKCRNNRPIQIKMSAMYKTAVARQDKRLISVKFLVTLLLIVGKFSTDADPEGRHFNYIAFHVIHFF